MIRKFITILSLFLILGVSDTLTGQADTVFTTPYAAIYNHLYYLQNDSYNAEQSALSFDNSLDKSEAIEFAIKLKQILDGKGLYVQMSKVPENPAYKDSLTDKFQYYLFPDILPTVYVEREDSSWYYGPETETSILALHKKTYPLGTDRILSLLDKKSGERFLGLNSWQYIGIIILLLLAVFIFYLLKLILRPLLRRIGKMSFHLDFEDTKLLNRTSHVLGLLIVFVLVKYIFPVLQLPVKWTLFARRGLDIIITVFLALLLLRVLEYVINYFKIIADKTESKMDDQLIPIISQILRLVVIIAAIFQVLHLVNVNIAALIAGISIGGLALALAAKDTVSNLIGSLMIFLDKPFQIGDFIEMEGHLGTVKEVGFRSTRIQTKDTSIISIPNGKIANSILINKGIRVYRLFEITLGVTYDTPADLVEVFVDGLNSISIQHPKVINEDNFIHMSGFGASSLDIFFRVYLDTTLYAEELAIKEDISLSILRLADSLGVRFAFPSTTVYVEQLPGQKDLIPEYSDDKSAMKEKLDAFMKAWGKKLKNNTTKQ